jgi:Fe-Mn family superoxide dismutase
MVHTLPQLTYQYDALEPVIDAQTMEIHHTKHHQAYIDKLNTALEKYPDLQEKSVEELLINLNSIPDDIKTAVKNHGGGHYNHSLFWQILKKDVSLTADLKTAINESFGSFEIFVEKFSEAATTQFGSGWAWLSVDNNKLTVTATANQDSPLSLGMTPILGLDVWEHAYYLKYQNKRADYIKAFFSVINWEQIDRFYQSAK